MSYRLDPDFLEQLVVELGKCCPLDSVLSERLGILAKTEPL